MASDAVVKLGNRLPKEIRELLGIPPLLPGESAPLYYAILVSFAQSVAPSDFIGWIILKDLADVRTEINRCRALKTQLMAEVMRSMPVEQEAQTTDAPEDPAKTLDDILEKGRAERKMEGWRTEGRTEEEKIEIFKKQLMHAYRSPMPADPGGPNGVANFEFWMSRLQQVEQLLVAAEDRFTAGCEELDWHCRRLANRGWGDVIDGETVDMTPAHPRSRRGRARVWRPPPGASAQNGNRARQPKDHRK
jgi:hypothetical protein